MRLEPQLSTYQTILEAGYRVLGPNPSASLSEVALAAGVSRATLHRHFNGRDALIRALTFAAATELEAVAEKAAKGAWSHIDAMHKIFKALVPLGERQHFLLSGAAAAYPEVQEELERQNTEFMAVIKAAQKEGLCPDSCPPEWVMQTYDLMIYGAWQMIKDGHATPKQATKLAWTTFKNGLKKTKL